MIDWSQSKLADMAGLSLPTIKRLEAGRAVSDQARDKAAKALEDAGIEFIPENGSGAGVRLRKGAVQ